MKREELMIGDWYYWEAEGKKYPMQVTKDDFSLLDDDIANFEPIPITAEILEYNSFVGINPKHTYTLKDINSDKRIGISVRDEEEMYCGEIYYAWDNTWAWPGYLFESIMPCLYVHQLQHILKDFGIQKNITLPL